MVTMLHSSLENSTTQKFRLDISRPIPVDFQTSPPSSTVLLFLTSKHPSWFSLLLEYFQCWSNTTQGPHCAHLSKNKRQEFRTVRPITIPCPRAHHHNGKCYALCSSRKYLYSPTYYSWGTLGDGGSLRPKNLKKCMKLEFPEGWGGLRKKSLP